MGASWRSSPDDRRRVWFHVHTSLTHGRSTPREYLELAGPLGVDQVVFLEHVRRVPTYDTDAFRREVERAAALTAVDARVGFEAKILQGGALDIPEALLASADVVGIAEHSWSGDSLSLAEDFTRLVATLTETHPQQTFVWVHPGSWLRRSGEPVAGEAVNAMLRAALAAGVFVERNLKYDLLPAATAARLSPATVIYGLDAHSTDEALERWGSLAGRDG